MAPQTIVEGSIQEAMAASLVHMTGIAVLVVDGDGLIRMANAGAQNLLGVNFDELNAQPYDLIFSEAQRTAELPQAHRILAHGEGCYRSNATWLGDDGQQIPVELIYTALEASKVRRSGQHGPVMILAVEISHYAHLQEALRETLAQLDRLKTKEYQSLKDLSHEIRAPLMMISLSLGLLRDYADRMSMPERCNELGQIERAVGACQQMLDNALTLARPPVEAQLPSRTKE